MEVKMIDIEQIVEDEEQPRREMDQEALEGLADSIKQHGLLQPITVRPLNNVNMYQIITGERRWRASQLAGLTKIPCVVRPIENDDILTQQLIENLQREDLQPLDKAKALNSIKHRLMVTNKELAQRIGLGERMVHNLLSIMNLPDEIGEKIVSTPNRPADGKLTEKHARHLRQLNDEPELQQKVVEKIERERLSGEDAGKLVSRIKSTPEKAEEFLNTAVVEMPGKAVSGPAAKVQDTARYLQGLELTRLSGKQLNDLQQTLTELKKTADLLLDEVRQVMEEKSASV